MANPFALTFPLGNPLIGYVPPPATRLHNARPIARDMVRIEATRYLLGPLIGDAVFTVVGMDEATYDAYVLEAGDPSVDQTFIDTLLTGQDTTNKVFHVNAARTVATSTGDVATLVGSEALVSFFHLTFTPRLMLRPGLTYIILATGIVDVNSSAVLDSPAADLPLTFIHRRTKVDAMLGGIQPFYDTNPTSRIRELLTAFGGEDERIGGTL